jgi:Tol biopolymer transport system component
MIDERELREMLERRASTISATPTDAPKAIRRARRRIALNAAVGTLVGLVVLAGALAGVRIIQAAPTPAEPPTPRPTPARLGSLAYAVDGDIYVAEWDGSNAVRIADGRPPNDCGGLDEYSAVEQRLLEQSVGPIWSPDGRYLAYRHMDCDAPQFEWDVVVSDAEGNVVTSFPSEGWGISWSPDSTRVAVWVRFGETIGVYGLDGERRAVLTVPPGIMKKPGDSDPVWSRDGGSLLVPRGVEIPLDGSAPRKLPSDDPRTETSATYSPDGSRVAYTTAGSLVVAAADGSHARQVLERWVQSPVWSPTGDQIAFTYTETVRWPYATELRVLDLATGTVTSLAGIDPGDPAGRVGTYEGTIDFSPDGDRILFSRTEGLGSDVSSLWSVNADGSDVRRLVTEASQGSGDWLSPSPTR